MTQRQRQTSDAKFVYEYLKQLQPDKRESLLRSARHCQIRTHGRRNGDRLCEIVMGPPSLVDGIPLVHDGVIHVLVNEIERDE